MKKLLSLSALLFIILALFTNSIRAQNITLEDDFEDQNLNSNPEWTGDLGNFTFFDDDGNTLLRLDAPDAGSSQLRTASTTAYGTWEFFIDQDFPPSNNNRGFIFLTSDSEDLTDSVNGYAIRTGENSSPNFFRLFRFTNGTGTEILTGELDISGGGPYQLKITRDVDGEWGLYESEGYGSIPNFVGSVTDNTHTSSSFFGFQLNYTATRANNFYFDDFIIRDGIEPLKLVDVNIDSGSSLRLIFTEEVDETSLQTSDFELNNIEPASVSRDAENLNEVIIEFGDGLNEGESTLSISNIDDFRGNTIEPVDFEFTITSPFFIESIELTDATRIEIEFSEEPDETDLVTSAFSVSGVGNPESIEFDSGTNPTTARLTFSDVFEDGDYELSIVENIRSEDNWNLSGQTEFNFTAENPFVVIGFTANSNEEIDIIFTESFEAAFINTSNFTIDGVGNPSNVESISAGTVRLTFDPELSAGSYTLVIGDIESVNGWPLTGDNEFEFTVFDQFEPGDLIISEFFYRVPIDWRTEEFDRPRYIELFNPSDKFLNLRDFTINGENINSGTDLSISPNEYLVITRGEPVFLEKFGERNFFEAENFPSLSLTTQNEIVLKTDDGSTVDSLFYRASLWGGNERSLERVSNDVSSVYRDNWKESTDALRGSPGLPNTVSVPTESPQVVAISYEIPGEIIVEFSRALSESSLSELSNFGLDNSAQIETVEYNATDKRILVIKTVDNLIDQTDYLFSYNNVDDIFGNEVAGTGEFEFRFTNPFRVLDGDVQNDNKVLVTFTQPLNVSTVSASNFQLAGGGNPTGIQFPNSENVLLEFDETFDIGGYTLVLNDFESIVGWEIEQNTEFDFFVFDTYEPGDILINEFMYNPPEGYSRYVELINTSDKILNLRDFELRRQEGASNNGGVISESSLAIEPNGYVVVAADTALMSSSFGQDSWFQMSGFPGLTVSSSSTIRLIDNQGQHADSLRYNPSTWGGNGVALERRRLDIDAIYRQNWAESVNELLGTPGSPNEVEDFEFTLMVNVLSLTELQLVFNLAVDENDLAIDKFSVNEINPSSFEVIGTDTLLLEFESPLPTGDQVLTVETLSSVAGWEIAADTEFSFFVFDSYEPGDILINEFMYNPPEGYTRYVELINTTDKILNLKNFELRRQEGAASNGGVITAQDVILEPNGFAVVASDTSLMNNVFGSGDWIPMSGFPGLTVTTESTIRLLDNQRQYADSLRYNPSTWGGNGVALERRSISVNATLIDNWGESPNELLGTPGAPNEIEIDSTPPQLVNISLFRDEGFTLSFDKQLESESATNSANYTISPELSISMVMHNGQDVTLLVSEELVNNQTYDITVEGVTDLFGNPITPITRSIEYLDFVEAEPRQVIVNEILYRRLQSGAPEFVEILNRTDENINLSGWTLSDASTQALLPSGTVIRGNNYLVFTDTESFAADNENIIYMSNWPGLSNNGDAVVLKNGSETVIDSLFYRPTWGNNTQGISLERKDPSALSIDRANWAPSTAEFGSTPAAENTRFEIDTTSPEIIFANLFHPDSLEVQFSKFVNLNLGQEADQIESPNELSLMAFDNHESVQFLVNGSPVDILLYNPLQANRVILDGSGIQPGEAVSISIQNLPDFQGNVTTQQSIPVALPISEGDLVFNEIMFNPISGSSDGLPDQSDYIEIYNTRPYAVSLEGIFLHDQPDGNNQITRIDLVDTVSKWIPGNGFVVIYPETDPVSLSNSRTGRFFELDTGSGLFGLRADRSSLSLPNAGRQVYLADSTRNVIDMVEYSSSWHNPNLISTQGISLERINPNFETNDPSNWGSSTNTLGGTPAGENTLFQEQGLQPDEVGITLSPNPFSPDGDGFEDNLFINYALDEPDYLLRIRIYDRYGRLVRTLADGLNAGLSGSVIWNGRSDDGGRNRIGIYIIYVEAYNSANGARRAFRETAVLARQF